MGSGNEKSSAQKWKWTLMTTLIFLVVVNPTTYKTVNNLLSGVVGKIADSAGCPTETGIIVHSIVFTLLLRGLMEMKV